MLIESVFVLRSARLCIPPFGSPSMCSTTLSQIIWIFGFWKMRCWRIFDALSSSFDEIRLWRDPACPACGDGVAQPQTVAVAAQAVAAS